MTRSRKPWETIVVRSSAQAQHLLCCEGFCHRALDTQFQTSLNNCATFSGHCESRACVVSPAAAAAASEQSRICCRVSCVRKHPCSIRILIFWNRCLFVGAVFLFQVRELLLEKQSVAMDEAVMTSGSRRMVEVQLQHFRNVFLSC